MIQHYVMKFVSDLRQVSGFLRVLRFPPPTARHKITEILLKMAINNINHLNETKSNRVMDLISKVMKWWYLYIKLNDHGIELLCFHYHESAGMYFLLQQCFALNIFSEGHSD